jgi:hypothetical protein
LHLCAAAGMNGLTPATPAPRTGPTPAASVRGRRQREGRACAAQGQGQGAA